MKLPKQIEANIIFAQLKILQAEETLSHLQSVCADAAVQIENYTTSDPIKKPLYGIFKKLSQKLAIIRDDLNDANSVLKSHRPPLKKNREEKPESEPTAEDRRLTAADDARKRDIEG